MRKLILILLALCLAVMPCLAEDSSLMEYNFGDFTMTIPSDMVGEIADEIKPNEAFFTLYQDYNEYDSFHINMCGIWDSFYEDFTQIDPEEFGNMVIQQAVAELESCGIDAENPVLLGSTLTEHEGKPVLSLVYSVDTDYTSAGYDLNTTSYYMQILVSDPCFGTYSFTIATYDLDAAMPLIEILNTLTWND